VYRRSRNRFGCRILQDTFTIVTNLNTYSASIVLGALGKDQDIKLKRSFIQKQSHWLGVKRITRLSEDYVGLHHFKGGYCGVSKIQNNGKHLLSCKL
jgi:hypothetical protein